MTQKRLPEQDTDPPSSESSSSDDKRRKIPTLRNVVLEVMKFRTIQQYIEPVLEPLIRRVTVTVCETIRAIRRNSRLAIRAALLWNIAQLVFPFFMVREEVDLALKKLVSNMKRNPENDEIPPSDSRKLQLQFLDSISLPVFTGSRIEGEECTTMKVALVDALTGKVVSSGSISSAKVEIVVLEGDFDGNEVKNWKPEEFKSNLVREREGKKALLTGDSFLYLKEGVGLLGDISFTDNSSWTRSRKFRLGAKVVDNCDGIRVREAKTESFIVRDHRGELYKKHHPPSLYDEVWRLEKIGKEGAFHKRLSREKVNTVKDFLTLLNLDPARLRYVLGTGMSTKMWEVTVEHARTCVVDKKIYLFCHRSQEKTGVVFNVVGQLMGLLSDCHYVPTDRLSETEKVDANNSIILAFKQWEEVVSFDDESALVDKSSILFSTPYSSNSSMVGSSDGMKVDGSSIVHNTSYPSNSQMIGSSDVIKAFTSDNVGSFDYPQLHASTPDIMSSIYSMDCTDGMNDYGMHNIESIDVRFGQTLNFPDQVSNSLSMICDTDSITHALCNDERMQYFDSNCSLQNPTLESQADLQSAVSGFLYARSAAAVAMVKAQRRWTILFSVLRWFSIRRIVARKSVSEKHRYIDNNPCQTQFQSQMQL